MIHNGIKRLFTQITLTDAFVPVLVAVERILGII